MTSRLRSILLLVLTGLAVLGASTARGDGPEPYFRPPFAGDCNVHRFGEGAMPDVMAMTDDPLCVEYAKRDITVSNGGVIWFTLAEPARFIIAADKCQYWQRDHWSVQTEPGLTPVVRWDGSYWWDEGAGLAGARIRHLTIGGEKATMREAARYFRPYSPELANYFRAYYRGGDGMAFTSPIPFNPLCA